MTRKDFSKKLKELLIGKRSLRNRVFTALWPSLSLSFILYFFGPLDISKNAESYVDYSLLNVLPACLLLWVLTFAVMFLISWLPGGKMHVWLCSLFAGLTMAFYLQGSYLNIDLGPLDGEGVEWELYGDNALSNLAVFLGIMLIPFLIHFFSRKLWRHWVVFTSLLLLIMQAVPLGITLVKEVQNQPVSEEHYVLLKDKEYVLGKENIVVFILDHTGPEELSATLEEYPDMLSPFHDFQQFDNFNSEHVSTFPAAAYLLTHQPYERDIPYEEWFEKVWHAEETKSFYNQMEAQGWTTRVFNNAQYVMGDLKNGYGTLSNIEKADKAPDYTIDRKVFRKLIRLSYYRYFPLIMKAPFWIYTDELMGMRVLSDDERAWNKNGSVQKYLQEGLTLGDEEKVYVTYHYAGAHWPFRLNDTGLLAENSTSLPEQLAGHFHMIEMYLQQMKDFGIYDSSSVIITTDHGNDNYPQSIFFIKPAGQQQNKMTVSHAPVSQSDFPETIAELAGLDKGQFGRSIFDVPEDEERLRCTAERWEDPAFPKVAGKASNAIRDMCYIGDSDTIHQMVAAGDYESTPLEYPFY